MFWFFAQYEEKTNEKRRIRKIGWTLVIPDRLGCSFQCALVLCQALWYFVLHLFSLWYFVFFFSLLLSILLCTYFFTAKSKK